MNVSAAKVQIKIKPCKRFPFARLVNPQENSIPYFPSTGIPSSSPCWAIEVHTAQQIIVDR